MTTVRATIHVQGLAPGEVADLDTDVAKPLLAQGWVERVSIPRPFTSTPDDGNAKDAKASSDSKDAKASDSKDTKASGRKDS